MSNRRQAIKIVRQLRSAGYQALLAGGCVRDMLLGRRPKDFDVATDARPEDVMRIFKRTLKVGAQFGVVVVLTPNGQVEVATFRTESGYDDGRHPTNVHFVTAAEDARRRDFTVNGMFYDPIDKKVIDYVGGRADLDAKIVRTIGPPGERFAEDYLRMLRAVRFSTELDFTIAPATKAAITANAAKITAISGERICAELERILIAPRRAEGASLLAETGLLDAIFPQLSGENVRLAIAVLSKLRKRVDFGLALSALFAGCETDAALSAVRVLKLSRQRTKHIRFLLANRRRLLDENLSLGRLKLLLAQPYFWDLYELQRAIQKAQPSPGGLAALVRLRRRIRELGGAELRPKPILNGYDLMRLGATPGPRLGQLAEELYIAQLEGRFSTIHQAEQWVRNWLREHKDRP